MESGQGTFIRAVGEAHMQVPTVQASMTSRKIKSHDCVYTNSFPRPVIPFSGTYSEEKKEKAIIRCL